MKQRNALAKFKRCQTNTLRSVGLKTYRCITYNLTIFLKDRGRTLLREGQTGQIQDHNRKLKAAVKEIQRHATLLNTDSLCDVERSGH